LVEYLNRHLKTVLAAHDVDSFERHWSNSTHHHSVLLWVQSDSTDATTAHIIHSHHSQPHALTTLVRIEAMGYPRTMPLPPILVNAPLLTTPFTPRSVLHLLQNLDSLQPSDHPAQLLSPAPAPIARGSKILIAEDDEINRVLMRELLRTQGYSVELALNGQEALDRLSSELDAFALVILDLHMPVLDGLQAARAISALPGSAALPLIAMSAETLEETRQMIDSIGFSEILSKPVDPQQLFELLRRRVAAPASLLPPLPQLPFPTLSGIDTTAGLNHAGHNRPLYARLLLTFIKANQQTASALASQEINPSVRGRIHTLKGASGSIGAKQLHALAEKLLDQLDHHNGAGYRASLAQLADALSEIIASITAARPALEELCAKAPDPSAAIEGNPTHAAVALLRQQLEEFDTGALESFSRLRPQLDWLSLETVEMIQQALERYDFETASSLLAT
jgi:CheY-like chemotaxis protein